MLAKPQPTRIHLPKGWQDDVKSAVLHAIALAHYAIVYARAWAADSINARARLAAENDRLREDCALLREELRIKDSRMTQIAPQRRPHYGPHERMAILELRAARGWSVRQTADTFLVTPATIASWLRRIDDQGANALLHLRCEDAGSQRHRPVTCRASTRVNFRSTDQPVWPVATCCLPRVRARR